MKFLFIVLLLLVLQLPAVAQKNTPEKTVIYNEALAKKIGADSYGMKKYVMAILRTGPNRTQDSIKREALQQAHLKNIFRLADEGKLVVAGPFLDGGEQKGIYIFNVSSLAEAKALTESDPAVQAGSLVMELHEWYGSAALVEIPALHKTLEKKSVADQ